MMLNSMKHMKLDVLFKNSADEMDCQCVGRNRHGDNQ